MNQSVFFERLKEGLNGLPKATIDEIVADYREYIGDALAAGRSEADVIGALGDPTKLARELKAQASYRQWEAQRSLGNLVRVVVSVAGLGLLQLLLLIPFLFYLMMLTFGYMVSGSLTVAGLIALVALSGHHLPGKSTSTSTSTFEYVSSQSGPSSASAASATGATGAASGIALSSVATAASGASAAGATDNRMNAIVNRFGGLRIAGDRLALHLDQGANAKLVTRAGPVELHVDNGKLDVEAPSQDASALFKHEDADTVSIARHDVQSLDLNSDDGHLSFRPDADGQKTLWDIHEASGNVSFEQDAQGHIANFHAQDPAGNVSINANGIAIDDDTGHFHISGLGGQTLQSIALRYASFALPIGLLGLALCVWLTVLTWRALVRYAQRQIATISNRLGQAG